MYQTVHVFPQRLSVTEETDPAGTGSKLQTQKKDCTRKGRGNTSDTLFIEPERMQMQKRVYSRWPHYTCSFCKKSFGQHNYLSNHLRVHQHPYKCDVCNKSFNLKSEHTLHLRLHTGERPYQCDVCKKSFTRQNSLTVHLRIHSGEYP